MNIAIIREIGLAILFVLLQAVVFNHIHLFGIAVPFVFIYIIFRLPLSMPVGWVPVSRAWSRGKRWRDSAGVLRTLLYSGVVFAMACMPLSDGKRAMWA